jgi:acyl dehydratase
VIKSYPHYDIWQNPINGDFDVVRWDSALKVEVVQTNIRTRGKAYNAMFTWRRRAKEQEENDVG